MPDETGTGSGITFVEWATLVVAALTLVGVAFTVGKAILWDWARPKWKYRRPFDVECEERVPAYQNIGPRY